MNNTEENSLASPCGLYCGECLYYKKQCDGCVPSKGRPSWGQCKTYACTTEKKVEHCGDCSEFPCTRFLGQYSRQLGRWRVFYKAGQLIYRKRIGTTSWVAEKAGGKNPDPKVTMERHLLWQKAQKRRPRSKKSTRAHQH